MEEYRPLVSIIMPAYNVEKYVQLAIESILDQTYTNWELLICDDASTDDTLEVIKSYSDTRIKIFTNTNNIGYTLTCNFLLSHSKGKYITFQDGDDYSDFMRLELQLNEFRRNSLIGVVGAQISQIDSSGNLIRNLVRPTEDDVIKKLSKTRNVIGNASMMIKRESLELVGMGYRDFFSNLSYQDYDLSLLLMESFEVQIVDKNLYFYRQHNNSNSKKVEVDRRIAFDFVKILAEQRKETGKDYVQLNEIANAESLIEELRLPYKKDKTLVYREYAADFVYSELYDRALYISLKGLIFAPFRHDNWGTAYYCIKQFMKSLVRF